MSEKFPFSIGDYGTVGYPSMGELQTRLTIQLKATNLALGKKSNQTHSGNEKPKTNWKEKNTT